MNVSYHLYFPQEADAHKAADALKADGFTVETRLGADGANWLTLASCSVDDQAFTPQEQKLDALARQFGGTLDGYEEEG